MENLKAYLKKIIKQNPLHTMEKQTYVTNYFLKDHYKNNLPVTIFRLFKLTVPNKKLID